MMLFDSTGKIARYESALDILTEFCGVRRSVYEKRKDYLVSKLTKEKEILSNKARFILMVVNDELEIRKKKKEVLLKELMKLKFTPMSELNAIMKGKDNRKHDKKKKDEEGDDGEEGGEKDEADADKSDFDYLLGMNLWSLTQEKVDAIKKDLKTKEDELKELRKKTIEQFWDQDLDALSEVLDQLDLQDEKDLEAAREATEGRRRKVAGSRGKQAAPAVVRKRQAPRDETKMLMAPLVQNAGDSIGTVQKSISGLSGESGPTRFSAADIPIEDQQTVSRDPDIIQRAAKAPRKQRAPSGAGRAGEDASPQAAAEPPPPEDTGGSLLARLLKNKPTASVLSNSGGSHGALSTTGDFFFGSGASIFSSGLPEPEAATSSADPPGEEPPSKKAKKAGGKKKKGDDDDDDDDA